ncbi:hypothetical protein JCM11641_000332 [Rhodosporidiobolus odoratus]
MAGLLSNGLVQLALVSATPILLPKAIRLGQAFLNPRPAGKRTPADPQPMPQKPPPDDSRFAALRLFILALGVSLAVFSALNPPHNLFLLLSPPHSLLSQLLPSFRRPLDLRLATETLAKAWQAHLARPLADSELALAQRLQTLDARLAYIAYGAGPLMSCSWCKPPGTTATAAGLLGTDYFLAIAPSVALVYLSALAAAGVMLAGNGRQRYRKWPVMATVGMAAWESWQRLTWEGARGGVGGSVSMLHTHLHLIRLVFTLFLLILSYLAPPAPPPLQQPTTASILGPTLSIITTQTETALHRIRALSLLRKAVLQNEDYREKVTAFHARSAREATLARPSPAIKCLLKEQIRPAMEASRAWLDVAMSVPRSDGGEVKREGETEEAEGEEERDHEEDEEDDRAREKSTSHIGVEEEQREPLVA